MSVWSSVTGDVWVERNFHFSLKKYTQQFFDEVEITVYNGGSDNHQTFSMSICKDGIDAFKSIEQWVKGIPGRVDLTSQVRILK